MEPDIVTIESFVNDIKNGIRDFQGKRPEINPKTDYTDIFKFLRVEREYYVPLNIKNCVFSCLTARNLHMPYVNAENSRFFAANLEGANFKNGLFSHANFAGFKNPDGTITYTNLRGADFHEAKLRSATMYYADLTGADLSEADLSNADLRGSIFNGANLKGTMLNYAFLENADLRGVKNFFRCFFTSPRDINKIITNTKEQPVVEEIIRKVMIEDLLSEREAFLQRARS